MPTNPVATERKIISTLLMNRGYLKFEVVRCFKLVAGGAKHIDLEGLRRFRDRLCQTIGVSSEVFGNLDLEFIRFDFDGIGTLHFAGAYMLSKHRLFARLKVLGGLPEVEIPTRTLGAAGYTFTGEILGKGSQAVVKLALDQAGNERSIKCFAKRAKTITGLTELKDEFETMRRLSCRRIAHAFEMFQDVDNYYMVNEVYRGGDLTTLKQRSSEQGIQLTQGIWQTVFHQCFEALAFMHEHAMMHCDIKETNIMLRNSSFSVPEVVLIDFGLTRAMAADEPGLITGTLGYIPPETWQKGHWFPGGDVFSTGVCMLQVLIDKTDPDLRVFCRGCKSMKEVKEATTRRKAPFHLMPQDMPGLTALIQRTMEKRMDLRPRAPQVLQDPWFGPASPTTAKPVQTSWFRGVLRRLRPGQAKQNALYGDDSGAPNFFTSVIDEAYFNSVPSSTCPANAGAMKSPEAVVRTLEPKNKSLMVISIKDTSAAAAPSTSIPKKSSLGTTKGVPAAGGG
jgi:serine/threonine protein kinase